MAKRVFPYVREYHAIGLGGPDTACTSAFHVELNIEDPREAFPQIVQSVHMTAPGVVIILGPPPSEASSGDARA